MPTGLRAALAEDRFLAGATAFLGVVTCAPLLVTPYVPLHDLPDHVGASSLIFDVLGGNTVAAEHYRIQLLPVPYWVMYALLAVGGLIFGPLLAAKLVVALAVLLLPLGMMRLALALGRDPRLGLLGFALAWDNNMMWGFVAYELGLGLAFFALASVARAKTSKEAFRAAPWSIALALTHAQSFGVFAALGLTVVGRPARWNRRLGIWIASLVPGILILIPWVIDRALAGGTGVAESNDTVDFHSLQQHFGGMFGFSTGVLFGPTAHHAGKLAFAVMASAPLILGAMAVRRALAAWIIWLSVSALSVYLFMWPNPGHFRTDWLVYMALVGALSMGFLALGDRHRWSAAAAVLMATALYFAFPMGVTWPIDQWYIYPRHATVFLAVTAIAPPVVLPPLPEHTIEGERVWIARAGLRGPRVLTLLPGLGAATVLGGVAINQFAAFADRARPFQEIVEDIPPEPRLLTLTLHDSDPSVPYHPFNQFHAYVVAAKGGYDPYLFDNPSTPFVHIKKLPHPPWNQMGRFSMDQHGRHYDHILVQGTDVIRGRRSPAGRKLERVTQKGRWTLYRVVKDPGPPPAPPESSLSPQVAPTTSASTSSVPVVPSLAAPDKPDSR